MADASEGPPFPSLDEHRMAHPGAPPPMMSSSASNVVNTDVACKRCGSNLRGLTSDQHCTHCGLPVGSSLQESPLILSPPAYLRSVSIGVIWIIVVSILQIAAVFVLMAIVIIVVFSSAGSGAPPPLPYQPLWGLAFLPFNIALLYGWWQFTSPDPTAVAQVSGIHSDPSRGMTRWAMVAMVGIAIVSAIINAARGAPVQPFDLLALGMGLASIVVMIVQFFASLLYVRWLAQRMQHTKLVARAMMYLWLLPLIYIVGACVIVGPIVGMVMYLLLLNDVRRGVNWVLQQQAASGAAAPAM